ncbi:MAG: ATP-grasp domain-containing protein, partial [Patescibacteria group bacterium]
YHAGYPVLVRPSYVLSGAAMNVVYSEQELTTYSKQAADVSPDHPVVMSQFIQNAKELEVDGVAQDGRIIIEAISEHVEHAGVHSGDAAIVLPPQRLYLETIRRTKDIAKKIVAALAITGPFNIQFLAKDNEIKVIECNVRASRSFPFVSKVTGYNFIDIAVGALLGEKNNETYETLELGHVGVKMPQFSYARLKGSDPVAHVEMASTGEVACIGQNYLEAFLLSWLSTEQAVRGKRILISIGGEEKKQKFLPFIRALDTAGWDIYATEGTHAILSKSGIGSRCLYKASEALEPNITTAIAEKKMDIIINIPRSGVRSHESDGYRIRRLAIDHHIPLITDAQSAQVFLQCLTELDPEKIQVKSFFYAS